METVFTVKKYLAVNGLPFRGDNENRDISSENFGGGLYLNTFSDLLFKLDPNLRRIAERLPANAKYTSSDMIIMEQQSILQTKFADKVKRTETFTIMMDGSSDKWEIEGIVVRFTIELYKGCWTY